MAPTHTARARKRFLRGALACFVLAAAGALLLAQTNAFRWLEAGTYDARVRTAAKSRRGDANIVIVDVDTASFDRLREKLGRWPWTRRVWAQVVDHVGKGRPRAIVFDIFFSGASDDATADQEFAVAMRNANNVVLAYTFTTEDELDFSTRDAASASETIEARRT